MGYNLGPFGLKSMGHFLGVVICTYGM